MSELGDWARRNAHKSKLSAEVVNVVLAANQLIASALEPENKIEPNQTSFHPACRVEKRYVNRLDQAIAQLMDAMDEQSVGSNDGQ